MAVCDCSWNTEETVRVLLGVAVHDIAPSLKYPIRAVPWLSADESRVE
jgi:hypothetical protein